jgi:hypothetical protein
MLHLKGFGKSFLVIVSLLLPGLLVACGGDEAATANASLNRDTATSTVQTTTAATSATPTETIRSTTAPATTNSVTTTAATTTRPVQTSPTARPTTGPATTPAISPTTAAKGGALSFAQYIDPRFLTALAPNQRSHYIQAWRAYLETVPASNFVNGVGINYRPDLGLEEGNAVLMQHLARNGFNRVRLEFGWGHFNYDNPDDLTAGDINQEQMTVMLKAAKANGLRPVIALTIDDNDPVPALHFDRTVMKDTLKGSTVLQLDDVSDIRTDYSGVNDPSTGQAAGLTIVEVDQAKKTITLARPTVEDIKLGEDVSITTLKYRPFGPEKMPDGTPNLTYEETLNGWKRFVGNATKYFKQVLGDTNFDLEIWSPASGGRFLNINNYYPDNKPVFPNYKPEQTASVLAKVTADYVKDPANKLPGVKVSDGFGAVYNSFAGSNQPGSVDAISKAANTKTYDFGSQIIFPDNKLIGADLKPDSTNFDPGYKAMLPEFWASGISPNNILRDFAPFTSEANGIKYGRDARGTPVQGWITAAGADFSTEDRSYNANTVMYIKAKMAARYLTFFLNKGANLVTLDEVGGEDLTTGLVSERLLRISRKEGVKYPTGDEATYTSPAMSIVRNMVAKFKEGLDSGLAAANTRQLEVDISEDHSKFQFNPGRSAPTLFDREVLAILPYQLSGGKDLNNKSKFIIPYYVMTRDIMNVYDEQKKDGPQTDLPPEAFTLTIRNLKGEGAKVSVYDPLNDKSVPVEVVKSSTNSLQVKVNATDYPYLLIVEE